MSRTRTTMICDYPKRTAKKSYICSECEGIIGPGVTCYASFDGKRYCLACAEKERKLKAKK